MFSTVDILVNMSFTPNMHMMKRTFDSTLLTVVLFVLANGKYAYISLQPSEVEIENNETSVVNVTCAAPVPTLLTLVQSIFIYRNLFSEPTQNISFAVATTSTEPENGAAKLKDTSVDGAQVSGTTIAGFISVRMTRASCRDAGMYICGIVYNNTDTDVSSKNLIVHVLPGMISMSVTYQYPDNYYTILVMKCTGRIGDPKHPVLVQWVWEYRNDVKGTWIPYLQSGDVTESEPYRDPDFNCQMLQSSKLTRTVTEGDDTRMYRCYVRYVLNDGQTRNFLQYSTVYVVRLSDDGPNFERKPTIAVVLGSILGSLVLVVLGNIALYRHCKQQVNPVSMENPPSDWNTGGQTTSSEQKSSNR